MDRVSTSHVFHYFSWLRATLNAIHLIHFYHRGERENIFVFIGKNLNHEWLKDCFKKCIVTEKLRFAVGEKVQANIGEFVDGKIKALWDDGNAYRIELDDEDKTNVYAPIDMDAYVRAPKSSGQIV